MHSRISKPRKALLAGLVVWGALSGGCQREEAGSAGATRAETSRYEYTVRGEVVTLPEPGKPLSALMIRHEPIPDFRDREGKVVGMPTMTMEFPPAEGLSLDGLAPGDKVEVIWVVSVESTPQAAGPPRSRLRSEVTRIAKLAPETELRFGR